MKKLILFTLLVLSCGATYAQQSAFCKSLDTLVTDADNRFRFSRDTVNYADQDGMAWICKVKVPGVIAARILSVLGLYYEGALYQTKNLDSMKLAYEQYKGIVNNCLQPKGFEISYGVNHTQGIEDLKKVIYMRELKEDDERTKAPPHVALEVGYYKVDGTYTLILYVFAG